MNMNNVTGWRPNELFVGRLPDSVQVALGTVADKNSYTPGTYLGHVSSTRVKRRGTSGEARRVCEDGGSVPALGANRARR
jgi:hypothetical protein